MDRRLTHARTKDNAALELYGWVQLRKTSGRYTFRVAFNTKLGHRFQVAVWHSFCFGRIENGTLLPQPRCELISIGAHRNAEKPSFRQSTASIKNEVPARGHLLNPGNPQYLWIGAEDPMV